MRVTQQQLHNDVQRALQQRQEQVQTLQAQISSGKRLQHPSDDPASVAETQRIEFAIDQLTQYNRNIVQGRLRLQQTEANLQTSSDMLLRARELALMAANSTTTDVDARAIAAEVEQLESAVLAAANARHTDGTYLFGGSYTAAAPFQRNPDGRVQFVGNNTALKTLTAAGQHSATSLHGADVFQPATAVDVFGGFTALKSALALPADNAAQRETRRQQITGALEQIDTSHQHIALQTARAGLHQQELDRREEINSATHHLLQTRYTNAMETDLNLAISDLQQQLTNLQVVQETSRQTAQLSLFSLLDRA